MGSGSTARQARGRRVIRRRDDPGRGRCGEGERGDQYSMEDSREMDERTRVYPNPRGGPPPRARFFNDTALFSRARAASARRRPASIRTARSGHGSRSSTDRAVSAIRWLSLRSASRRLATCVRAPSSRTTRSPPAVIACVPSKRSRSASLTSGVRKERPSSGMRRSTLVYCGKGMRGEGRGKCHPCREFGKTPYGLVLSTGLSPYGGDKNQTDLLFTRRCLVDVLPTRSAAPTVGHADVPGLDQPPDARRHPVTACGGVIAAPL